MDYFRIAPRLALRASPRPPLRTGVGSPAGPPQLDGRSLLLMLGLLLWLTVTLVGPPRPAHARALPLPAAAGLRPAELRPAGLQAAELRPTELRPLAPMPVGHSLADVLRRFDPPPLPWAAGHRGVDLAAPVGSPVRAVKAGVVSFAGEIAGTFSVAVTHPGTGDPPLRTTYQPLEPLVATGDRVAAGQVIGTVAAGPWHCPASCLHWGLLRGHRYLDPLALVGLGRSRLLPPDGAQG
ncbi:murein hydrolase activator EnvC family protein [Streptacidiphilus albus]|uniref:murein hydrolase activator EnvC family protein n=1 Tax=Streptacidiphilus albus TaxID=105425 RepID=UPI00068C9847|nr:M23 family metallopeptidase [Streptacidiphilus albus]